MFSDEVFCKDHNTSPQTFISICSFPKCKNIHLIWCENCLVEKHSSHSEFLLKIEKNSLKKYEINLSNWLTKTNLSNEYQIFSLLNEDNFYENLIDFDPENEIDSILDDFLLKIDNFVEKFRNELKFSIKNKIAFRESYLSEIKEKFNGFFNFNNFNEEINEIDFSPQDISQFQRKLNNLFEVNIEKESKNILQKFDEYKEKEGELFTPLHFNTNLLKNTFSENIYNFKLPVISDLLETSVLPEKKNNLKENLEENKENYPIELNNLRELYTFGENKSNISLLDAIKVQKEFEVIPITNIKIIENIIKNPEEILLKQYANKSAFIIVSLETKIHIFDFFGEHKKLTEFETNHKTVISCLELLNINFLSKIKDFFISCSPLLITADLNGNMSIWDWMRETSVITIKNAHNGRINCLGKFENILDKLNKDMLKQNNSKLIKNKTKQSNCPLLNRTNNTENLLQVLKSEEITEIIFSTGEDKFIKLWDWKTGILLKLIHCSSEIINLKFFHLTKLESKEINSFYRNNKTINLSTVFPILITSSLSNIINFYDWLIGKEIFSLRTNIFSIYSFDFWDLGIKEKEMILEKFTKDYDVIYKFPKSIICSGKEKDGDNSIEIYNWVTNTLLFKLKNSHLSRILVVQPVICFQNFSFQNSSSLCIFTVSEREGIKIFNIFDKFPIKTLHSSSIQVSGNPFASLYFKKTKGDKYYYISFLAITDSRKNPKILVFGDGNLII